MTGEQSRQAPLGLPEDDPRAAPAIALARAALEQIAPAGQLGAFSDIVAEDGEVFAVRFRAAVPGYPDWLWSASLVQLPGLEPSVLEVGLLPGSGALLAPAWVPWAERLAEYEAGRSAEEARDETDAEAEDGETAEDDEGAGRSSRRRRQRRARTRLRRGRAGEESAAAEPKGTDRDAEPEAAAEGPARKGSEKAEKQSKAEKPLGGSETKKSKRKGEGPEAAPGKSKRAKKGEEADAAPGKPKKAKKGKRREGSEESAEPAPEGDGASREPEQSSSAEQPREPEQKRTGGRRGRRRVVVVPHLERDGGPSAADGDDFVEVEDVREFADDMDDVLDGVQFEPDDAPEGERPRGVR